MPTQSQIDFIIKIMEFKINETGLPFTRACYTVSKSIKLSQATLIKAARGNFTYKTAVKMSGAGWFSMKEYEKMSTGTSNNTIHKAPPAHANPNPNLSELQNEFNKLIQEAYDKGYKTGIESQSTSWYQEGFKKGKESGDAAFYRDGKRSGYKQGTAEGYDQGFKEGFAKGFANKKQAQTHTSYTIDINKLRNVFELSKRGSTDGEKGAARRAASVIISKWISSEFGDSVQVNIS